VEADRDQSMTHPSDADDPVFLEALKDLEDGSFSRLEPLFDDRRTPGGRAVMTDWCERGRLGDQPRALAEALTCACFLGKTSVATYLLERGADPSGGAGTGLNAIHWASNRGQLEAVRLLLRYKVPLETRSMYGGTALGTAVWSAINEPRGHDQAKIIDALLDAGARLEEVEYPTGHEEIDVVLRRHGAS
jgi:Ankyrin repeats (3 copies)